MKVLEKIAMLLLGVLFIPSCSTLPSFQAVPCLSKEVGLLNGSEKEEWEERHKIHVLYVLNFSVPVGSKKPLPWIAGPDSPKDSTLNPSSQLARLSTFSFNKKDR